MFSNLDAQSFHEAALESKIRQLRECSRLDEGSVSSCHGFRFHPQFCLCRVQVPAVRQICQLSLQRILSLICACLLPAIVAALAIEPPTAAGDSSQLATWSCQPVSKYVARIPLSTIPEDHQCPRVPTSSHQGSNDELTNNTPLRYHDAIMFSSNRAIEFESGCEDVMKCA